MVTFLWKDYDKCEGRSKGSTGWFNPDYNFFKRKLSTFEQEFNRKYMEIVLKVYTWNRMKRF